MAEILVDTSAWVDLMGGRRRIPSQFTSSDMVVSALAVAELASISAQGRVPRDWVGRMLTGCRIEELALDDAVEGGLLHGRLRAAGNGKVSAIDCIMYCTARRTGLPFITSDKDLRDQPGVHLL